MMSEYRRCPICKEYSFTGSHVCAPKWYGLHQDDYGDKDYIPPADVFADEGMDRERTCHWPLWGHSTSASLVTDACPRPASLSG